MEVYFPYNNVNKFPILGGRLLKGVRTEILYRFAKVSNPWREAIEAKYRIKKGINEKFPILGGRLLKTVV